MTTPSTRHKAWRIARLLIAGSVVLWNVQGASAGDDSGLHQFFSSIFGGNDQPAASAPQTAYAPAQSLVPFAGPSRPGSPRTFRARPLIVRLHNSKPKIVVAQVPTKPVKVSIFEDPTLRRGDAVMTAHGIRVFVGSTALPHTPNDFVTLTASKELSKDTSRVLAEVDSLPRG